MLLSILDILLLITICNIAFSTTGACYAYVVQTSWWRVPLISSSTYTVSIIVYLLTLEAMDNPKALAFLVISLLVAIVLAIGSSFGAWLLMHVIDKKNHLHIQKMSLFTTIYRVGMPWIPVIKNKLGVPLLLVCLCLCFYVTHYSLQNRTIYVSDSNISSKIKCRIYKPLIELDQLLNDDSLRCVNK